MYSLRFALCGFQRAAALYNIILAAFLERVTTAAGIHLFPFRTEKLSPPAPMVLRGDTLVVFVSHSHIGGDRGCDGFECPDELEALFVELAGREGPVELILAGDFFDFLQIGEV